MTELLKTTLAAPYHYKRNGTCYLRLRAQGSTSDSFTISLRTNDELVAVEIAKDILKRLREFHVRKPSATWKQLKARLHGVTEESLFTFHGDPSQAAYGTNTDGLEASRSFADTPTEKAFFFTPRGIVEPDCAIQKPDYGDPEKGSDNPRGEYRANLTCSLVDAQTLIDKIIAIHKANYGALVKQFLRDKPALIAALPEGKKLLKPYEGGMPFRLNDDGTVTFKIKGYASYIDSKTQESKALVLKVVDSNGKPIENVPAISGGSELKVRFSVFAYGWSQVAGSSIKLRIDSVMLIKLVEPEKDR